MLNPRPVLQDSYDPIAEPDLAEFEAEIHVRLPEQYRSFLLAHNGGNFPVEVANSSDSRDLSRTAVRDLYGLLTGDAYDLALTYRITKGDIPAGLLPIGSDLCNYHVCIKLDGDDRGSIWSHVGDDVPSNVAGWARVAVSFLHFVDSLQYDSYSASSWTESIPAFVAAERGDMTAIARYLDPDGDLEARNELGMTLLMCAACSRQSQIVRLLLEKGAQVNSRDNAQRTALYWAAFNYSLDSARLLVDAGADLEAADEEGNTPLLIGVQRGHRVPLFLIEQGANVNARNLDGETPLILSNNYELYLRPILLREGAI